MALVLKDRVKETTSTTGTGTYTLAGAVAGFEAFSSVGDGNTTYYACTDGTDFEVGIGTYTSSGTTLARTTILQSSNSDSAVSWSSGTRTIFCTQPAEKAVFLDASGDATIGGGLTVTGGSDGDILLKFDTDRSWQFQQSGDDSSTRLQLKANVSSKSFDIVNSDGDSNFQFLTSSTAPIFTLAEDASIKFEGATDDAHETTLTVTDPTADRTITFPDATGTVQLTDGSGASLTSLNASELGSGTVPNARLDAQLQDVAGLAVTDGNFIVGDGSNFVAESGSTARASLGLGTAAVLDTGISNTNVPKFTSGVADNDFLRVDGTAIEGRSASEVLSDIAAMPLAGGTFTGDVTLTDTDAGSSEGPVLTLNRDSSSPADSDFIGTIKFNGDNDAGQNVTYGRIVTKINDNTDGTEDGNLVFQALSNGSLAARMTLKGNANTVFADQSVKFDAGVNLIFEGATANANETTLTLTDPTADRTITLPDATGTVALTSDIPSSGISSGNVATFTSGAADNDFLRIDGTAIEGRSASEVLSDIAAMPLAGGTFTGDVTLSSAGDVTLTLEADTDNATEEDNPSLVLSQDGGLTVSKLNLNSSNQTVLQAHTNGDLLLQATNGEKYFRGKVNGAVELYHDNSKKLETTADGVDIISTDDGSSIGPKLHLYRNSASPADFDDLGALYFTGNDDAGNRQDYAYIKGDQYDVSNGSEDAALLYYARVGGSDVVHMQHAFGQTYVYGRLYLQSGSIHSNPHIQFEGSTANAHETTLNATDPTADRTITLPDATGTVQLTDGSGASLTSLNASQLSSGTVPNARLDAQLQDVAGLAVTNGGFIVGDGSNFVLETGATARTSLGLGTAAVAATGISNGNVPVFTSGVADDDFLRVNGTSIEGRSASELASDIGAATTDDATALAIALG